MKNTETDIWDIIAKVERENSTPEEVEVLNNWINENEENKLFYYILKYTKPKEEPIQIGPKERVYKRLKEAILLRTAEKKVRLWRYCTAASVAILVALVAYMTYNKNVAPKISYTEAQVPAGVRSKLILSDGTLVHLNSGSTLAYPNNFTGNERKVRLQGEAYFEVNKDAKHPFIVETKSITIKVLGTRFNVKAYNEDDFIETTLLEGEVALYRLKDTQQNDITILKPNDRATYNKHTQKITVKEVDASLSAIWKEGKYYFENETLASIVKKLERNFNVRIIVTSPELEKESFYGLFNTNKNLFQLLDIMKLHNSFTYKITKDTIYITKIK
ncbi:MAG TPA: FecR domain-containing protein [Bacteroidales bacterium]|nr:FecR domain-containing protein [Bacteroidales bacterium]